VLTAYRDFLPEKPTLPPPPSFLETKGGQRPAGTDALLEILRTAPELKTQVPRALSDTALLQYTSGTTGTAKAAEITHGNLVCNCELQRAYIGSGDNDVALGVLPWFHITGMECQMNMMAYMGATLVAIGRFDLVTVLRAIEVYRCTLTTLIATVNVAIVNFPKTKEFDLSSLRYCFSGGAPVPAAIARRWEEMTGHKLIEGYGLSETTAPTHINPPERPKYGTVGVPLPLTDARVVDPNDGSTELEMGKSGEIAVHAVESSEPSPFSHAILSGRPYTYLDDAPLEERRTRALSLRRGLGELGPGGLPVPATELAALDPDAVALVLDQIRPRPRDPDELHDLLLSLVAARPCPDWADWYESLVAQGRASLLDGCWVATERAAAAASLQDDDDAAAACAAGVISSFHSWPSPR